MDTCSLCDKPYGHTRGSSECPTLRLGHTVDAKYQLLRLLGVGGFGAVYEAQNLILEKRVALKMLHPKFSNNDSAVKRFQGEARKAVKLHHPGIVQIFNIGTDTDHSHYIEMECLFGEPLDGLLKRELPSIERTLAWFCQALEALEEAHSQGIIHRDLKPENLFLTRDHRDREQIKILDFGIAKDLTGAGHGTAMNMPMGTALYMSPEQAVNPKAVDGRADVYSMGATLYCLLTNQPTIRGKTLSGIMTKLATDEIERQPSLYRPEVPAWLDSLVAKSMAFDPSARFSGVSEMLEATQRGLQQEQQEREEATRRTQEAPLRQAIAVLQTQSQKMDLELSELKERQSLLQQQLQQQIGQEKLLTSLLWLAFFDGVILTLSGALEYVIGRSSIGERWIPAVDLSGRPGVSRKHARLFWQNGALFLEDLGSNNGTFVNEQPLKGMPPRPVKTGDSLSFGDVDLRLSYDLKT